MSLATRCTQCGTAFRVVQDQLKVSEGWVRCGRCSEVFNALEGLFDLDREGPISGSMSLRPLAAPASPHAAVTDRMPASAPTPPLRHESAPVDAAIEAEVASPMQVGYGLGATDFDTADTQIEAREEAESNQPMAFARDSRSDDDDALDEEAAPRWSSSGALVAGADIDDADARSGLAPVEVGEAAPAVGNTPEFLRDAERSALWQRPHMRLALAAAALLLSFTLFGQWALFQRDALVASWPEAAAPMAAVCDVVGCRIEPLRRIEALAVESSGLTRLEGSNLYRLQVSLRNRDTVPVMPPALDLTLTDTRSEVLARRVLATPELAAAVPMLPTRVAPGAELQLATVLDVGERRVAGYTVELFYP